MKKKISTALVCVAALGAAVVTGRIVLVELFPGGLQMLASALP